MDANNETPVKESKSIFKRIWNGVVAAYDYLISKGNSQRVWRPIDNIFIIGASTLMVAGMGQFLVSRSNAPSDKNGKKYVIFQEVFMKKVIHDEQKKVDSLATRGKISANAVEQYKNGDSTMAALIGQAQVKLKKIQARNDSLAQVYKARNDSIKESYKKTFPTKNPRTVQVKQQVRMPQKH